MAQSFLARTLNSEGHHDEAEKTAREAYTALVRVAGLDDSGTVSALQQLDEALAFTGRYQEAAKLFQDAIAKEASSPTAGQGNPFQLWYAFACVAAAANRPDEAVQYLRESVHRGYKYAGALMSDNDLKNLPARIPEHVVVVVALILIDRAFGALRDLPRFPIVVRLVSRCISRRNLLNDIAAAL